MVIYILAIMKMGSHKVLESIFGKTGRLLKDTSTKVLGVAKEFGPAMKKEKATAIREII